MATRTHDAREQRSGMWHATAHTALESTALLVSSLAGSALERVTLRHTMPSGASWRTRHVVKRLAPEQGWLGAATHDTRIREAQLARSVLLDALPHVLATPIRAVRIEGDPAAPTAASLEMDDVAPYLVRRAIGGASGRLTCEVLALLDALARLHARFWCDPRLRDPALGLVSPRDALLLAAPQTIAGRIAAGDGNPYLPLALRGWEAFFALAAPEDTAPLRAVLDDPTAILRAIKALPWTLVHGDVWTPNLGWLPSDLPPQPPLPTEEGEARSAGGEVRAGRRPLLLDWALAVAAPAIYDPLWLCGTTHALDPVAVLAAYRPRLERHLRARGIRLAPATWRALADASYLRTVLTCGEALGRAAADASAGAARRRSEARMRWWARRAARAALALMLDLQPA